MSQIKLTADSGGGTTSLKAPSSTTSNADVVLKLPVADGSANQVLKTDGSGQLSFTSNAGTTINNNADNRVITGSGTASTLNGEANFSYDGTKCLIGTSTGAPYANRNLTVAQGGSGNTTVAIEVRSPTDGDGRIVFTDSTSDEAGAYKGQIRYDQTNDFMSFNTNGDNERLRIDSSGRLLLGTTTEGHSNADDLTVASSADTGITIRSGTSSQSSLYFSDGTSGADEYTGSVVYNHSNNQLYLATSGSNRLAIDSSGKVGIGTTSPNSKFQVNDTNPVIAEFYHSDGGTNDEARISLGAYSSNPPSQRGVNLIAQNNGAGHNFMINTSSSHSAGPTEKLRIDGSGNLGVGTTSPHNSDSADGGWHVKPSASSGGPSMAFKRPDSGGTTYAVSFVNNTTGVGWIYYTNSAATYSTASDYRLKENVVPISDGITRLKTLKPSRFNFKVDKDKTVDGFIAHEVTAVPEAVSGTKDEVDSEGNPLNQGLDYGRITPLLTAALQEAIAKIEVLETKVAALEAA